MDDQWFGMGGLAMGFHGRGQSLLSGTFRVPLVPLLLIPKINLSSGKNNKQHRRACV